MNSYIVVNDIGKYQGVKNFTLMTHWIRLNQPLETQSCMSGEGDLWWPPLISFQVVSHLGRYLFTIFVNDSHTKGLTSCSNLSLNQI